METIVKQYVDLLNPISLAEMDSVRLQDRVDTKYTFSISNLPQLLSLLKDRYDVLDVNGSRIRPYETLYYDTHNFTLYYQHHNGHLNRFKVRGRRYMDSNESFLEVKFKSNLGRTRKQRIALKSMPFELGNEHAEFLKKSTKLDHTMLLPCLWVYYSRITLVSKTDCERVTIDVGLIYKTINNSINFEHLAIAELKQNRCGKSFFADLMKENRIRNNHISKYCLGAINLYSNLKANNFKSSLRKIHLF